MAERRIPLSLFICVFAAQSAVIALSPVLCAGAAGLDAFIDLMLSSLRGMGVARLFGPDPKSCAAQLAELASVIEGRCRHL